MASPLSWVPECLFLEFIEFVPFKLIIAKDSKYFLKKLNLA